MATASKNSLPKTNEATLNIQAYIRVRPLSSREKKSNVLEFHKRDIAFKSHPEGKILKTLAFDRVFDEEVKQISVYNTVVRPMIKDVIQGYNCTVFAYGQTGTGKTYTMSGYQDDTSPNIEDTHAGIIPRAMEDIFKELEMNPSEYQVSVSYIELYNEKLKSLLKEDSDDVNIQLIDDSEGGVFIKGVLPTPVKSKDEAFKLLQQGAERRMMASTLLNNNSSRSHTIFTITVNIKESTVVDKDDVLRIGKLHLVDLAGSENVSKSGASDISNKNKGLNRRMVEASNINKSLLTLGRVITSITENSPHIPYRESKLTRLLRDSLGGKTKTCIIGTISPAQANMDETESTLNYAYKARSIKNKPEKNQKISKKEFMQVASDEILKLKRDLEAMRHGDGFYISKESHEEMCSTIKKLDNQVKTGNERFYKLSEEYEQHKGMFTNLSADFDDKCSEYEELERIYNYESQKFKEQLDELNKEIKIREYLVNEFEKTEHLLTDQAKECKSVLELLADQSLLLHDKIDRKTKNEDKNCESLEDFKKSLVKKLADFEEDISKYYKNQDKFGKHLSDVLSGNIYDYIIESNRIILRTTEDFIKKTKKYTFEFRSAQEAMIQEISRDLNGSTSQLSVNLKNEKNNLENLIKDMETAVSDTTQQLQQIEASVQEARQTAEKYRKESEELKEDLKQNQEYLQDAKNGVLEKIKELQISLQNVMGDAAKTTSENTAAVEKYRTALKAITAALTAESEALMATLSRGDGSVVVKSLEQVLNVTQSLGDFTKTELDQGETKTSEYLDKLFNHERKLCISHEDVLVKSAKEHKAMTANIGHLSNSLKNISETKNNFERHSKEHEEEISQVVEALNACVDDMDNHYDSVSSRGDEFVEYTESYYREVRRDLESTLRKENEEISMNCAETNSSQRNCSQLLAEITGTVQGMKYSPYVPSGTTPQRLNKAELHYPRQLECTAPREVLLAKYREAVSSAAAESQTSMLSQEDVVDKRTETTWNIPSVVVSDVTLEVSGSTDSLKNASTCSGTSSSTTRSAILTPRYATRTPRRSLSLPDISGSPEENKENTPVTENTYIAKTEGSTRRKVLMDTTFVHPKTLNRKIKKPALGAANNAC